MVQFSKFHSKMETTSDLAMWVTCGVHVPFSFTILFLCMLSRNKPKSSISSTNKNLWRIWLEHFRVCPRGRRYHWGFVKYNVLQSTDVKWPLVSQSRDPSLAICPEDLQAFDATRIIKWHFLHFERPSYFIGKEGESSIGEVTYLTPRRGFLLELGLELSSSQSCDTVLSTKSAHMQVETAEKDVGCGKMMPSTHPERAVVSNTPQ